MSNTALIHGPLPETNYLYKNVVVKGNFPLASLLVHPDTKYTIKHNFDLLGQTIELPPNCILSIDGGMIYNGTLVGDDSIIIDANRLGNVLDNVIQTGTWKKQDVLNSLSIGTVISGDEPQVTITGKDGDVILNFVLPKGDKGETGSQGKLGIQGLLGIQGEKGEKGDKGTSITSFTRNSEETEDYLGYNVEFDDGSILSVNIPKGPKGDQGIQGIQGIQGAPGPAGPTGPQGPMGDVAVITPDQQAAFTMYSAPGQNTDGPMTQKAVTDNLVAGSISYDNSQSGLTAENVQGALDEAYNSTLVTSEISTPYNYGTLIDGFVNSSGAFQTSQGAYKCTGLIRVKEGEYIDTIVSGNHIMGIAAYSENNTTTADVSKSYVVPNMVSEQHYEVPQGISYVRISFRPTDVSVSNFYVSIYHLIPMRGTVIANKNDIEELYNGTRIASDTSAPYDYGTLIDGFVDSEGVFKTSQGAYKCTSRISVQEGEIIDTIVSGNYTIGIAAYTKDNITTADVSKSYIVPNRVVTEHYKVPQGIAYIRVCFRTSEVSVNNFYINIHHLIPLKESVEVDKVNIENSKKEISILFIGNSLTQDAVSYVPLLLRELAPDLKFKFYIWYNPGYTLAQQLTKFNNDETCKIFSICENGIGWGNVEDSVKMSTILSTYQFDIVCLQEYFNYQESANLEAFNGIIEYIENHYSHPFKVVTLFHQPKRDVAETVFSRTKTGNALLLKETVAEDMISSGIAIYRALSTDLDSLGDKRHLSNDGTHAQEGLPCMMQAYVTAMWVMKQVGVPMSVNNAASVVDNSNYASINVPGANLGTGVVIGTTEQVRLSQLVAIKAFKEGEHFVNANLTEY